jgi:hypothetical protein
MRVDSIASVSKAINKTPEEVKTLLRKFRDDGCSPSEIRHRLVFAAKVNGRKLVIINSSRQGAN